MSLILDESTGLGRARLEAKTGASCSCHKDGVWISPYPPAEQSSDDGFILIPNRDFVELVKYFLTNAKLEPGDARLGLIDWMRKLRVVKRNGWERLEVCE